MRVSSPTLQRLSQALRGSSEATRPMASLELPIDMDRFVTPEAISQLRAAAVLVAVIEHAATASILLTRRADTLRHHQGQISFPGGRRDEGDADFAAAALREAHEEVGLDPRRVSVAGYLDDYPTITGYRITPVVGVVQGPFTPVIDPGEVAETFDLPLQLLLADNAFERKAVSRDGFEVPFLELNHGAYRIWGATAGILWDLRLKLLA